jgi:hypothetical protein
LAPPEEEAAGPHRNSRPAKHQDQTTKAADAPPARENKRGPEQQERKRAAETKATERPERDTADPRKHRETPKKQYVERNKRMLTAQEDEDIKPAPLAREESGGGGFFDFLFQHRENGRD